MDPRDFVRGMTLPVRQAMAAVRWLEGRVRNRPKVSEPTPEKAALTDGDCVSQEILLVALRARHPDVGLDVEEDTPTAMAFPRNESRYTVVIDPIDGTLRYLRGDGPYAIIVGLEQEGRVLASLIGIPQADLLIRAVRGEGAEIARGAGPFSPAQCNAAARGTRLLVSYGIPDELAGRLTRDGSDLTTAAGGAIGVAPLLPDAWAGLRIVRNAEGMSRRGWVSALPTVEAGGCVEGLDGPLPDRHEPGVRGLLVAASPDSVGRLRAQVRDATGPPVLAG